jgi:hypothetical protein
MGGTAWWQLALEAVGAVLVLVLLYGVALVLRRRWISRDGGTFELSHRVRTDRPGRGWILGLGRYSGESLEWFRIFSLSLRPRRTFVRGALSLDVRRDPEASELAALYADHVVVCCDTPHGPVELAMSPSSVTGFQAWLEARPPGVARRA